MFAWLNGITQRLTRTTPGGQNRLPCRSYQRAVGRGLETLEDRRVLSHTVGLFANEPQSFDGYTLWGPLRESGVYLINNEGEQVHKWDSEFRPNSNYLLEDGTLLRTAQLPGLSWGAGGSSGRVEQLDWDSNVIWSFELATDKYLLHHDIAPILNPDGSLQSVLMIAWEKFTRQESLQLGRNPNLPTDNNGELWSETIIEVVPDYTDGEGGEIVWQWRLADHLTNQPAANPQLVHINYEPSIGDSSTHADWAHFNAIDYNPELDQLVVSSRDFSEIWVLDHSTTTAEAAGHSGGNSGMGGDLLYRWGNPAAYGRGTRANQQLFYQHNPTWIPPGLPGAGNILIYNNGSFRPGGAEFSQVVEITPPTNRQWILNNRNSAATDDLLVFNSLSDVPASWIPLTGDFDGDGFDTSGFYDPANQRWYLSDSTTAPITLTEFDTAQPGAAASWLPLIGDWDGVGGDSVGLYDPQTGDWYLSNSAVQWSNTVTIAGPNDPPLERLVPIAGDWNGSGADGVGLYDPELNRWVLNNQVDGSINDLIVFQVPRPQPNWRPITGDWNGDGKDTVGLYDAATNRWFLNNATDGSINRLIVIRAPEVPAAWRPLAGDWNNDGVDTVGLYDPGYVAGSYTRFPGEAFGPSAPTWTYTARPRNSFYSSIISGAQRLPNGNTLIDEGVTGRFFEVTPAGKTVWEYINPVAPQGPLQQGQRVPEFGAIEGAQANLVFRALRYPLDYPGLAGRSLESQGPIELYPEFGVYDPDFASVYLNSDAEVGNEVHEYSLAAVDSSWLPITGDWDNSGNDTVGFYDSAGGEFHLNNLTDGSFSGERFVVSQAGLSSNWIPVAGDWDNDGFDTVGLYNPSSNNWYFSDAVGVWDVVTTLIAPARVPASWVPLAGDWDGDGFDSVGFYVPGANRWILNNKIDGSKNDLLNFQAPAVPVSWVPVSGDWNGDGFDTVGLFDPSQNRWVLNNKTNGQIDDLVIFTTPQVAKFGVPLTGDWDGSDAIAASALAAHAPALLSMVAEAELDSGPTADLIADLPAKAQLGDHSDDVDAFHACYGSATP